MAIVAGAEPFRPTSYGPGQDARAYWAVSLDDPYVGGPVGRESAFLYSPAFLQLTAPLRLLPWSAFLGVWTMLLLVTLRWLSGPLLFAPVLILAAPELWGGNVAILLAAAIVVGFRSAGAWALVLLTKVTPVIGLLWFAVRRELRPLATALGVSAAVAIVSALIAPGLWVEWLQVLQRSAGSSTVGASLPVPLLVRLPMAIVLVIYAARTDRAWLVPIAAMLALPVLWWGGFAMLAGSVALRRHKLEEWLLARLGGLRTQPTGAGAG